MFKNILFILILSIFLEGNQIDMDKDKDQDQENIPSENGSSQTPQYSAFEGVFIPFIIFNYSMGRTIEEAKLLKVSRKIILERIFDELTYCSITYNSNYEITLITKSLTFNYIIKKYSCTYRNTYEVKNDGKLNNAIINLSSNKYSERTYYLKYNNEKSEWYISEEHIIY